MPLYCIREKSELGKLRNYVSYVSVTWRGAGLVIQTTSYPAFALHRPKDEIAVIYQLICLQRNADEFDVVEVPR